MRKLLAAVVAVVLGLGFVAVALGQEAPPQPKAGDTLALTGTGPIPVALDSFACFEMLDYLRANDRTGLAILEGKAKLVFVPSGTRVRVITSRMLATGFVYYEARILTPISIPTRIVEGNGASNTIRGRDLYQALVFVAEPNVRRQPDPRGPEIRADLTAALLEANARAAKLPRSKAKLKQRIRAEALEKVRRKHGLTFLELDAIAKDAN